MLCDSSTNAILLLIASGPVDETWKDNTSDNCNSSKKKKKGKGKKAKAPTPTMAPSSAFGRLRLFFTKL